MSDTCWACGKDITNEEQEEFSVEGLPAIACVDCYYVALRNQQKSYWLNGGELGSLEDHFEIC